MSSVLIKLQKVLTAQLFTIIYISQILQLQEYIEKFQQLIKFELEAENELIFERLQKYPTQRLIREGC